MADPNKIKAKIAAIVDSTSVVINKGANDGIRYGMKFKIFPKGSSQEISDPENPERKMKIELYAPEVIVREVYDNFALCVTGMELSIPETTPLYKSSFATISLFAAESKPTLRSKVEPISIGDPVEEIFSPLEIIKATYGSSNKFIDVTSKLNDEIKDNRLLIEASNKIAGDPCVGLVKKLIIRYKIDNNIYEAEYKENEMVKLP